MIAIIVAFSKNRVIGNKGEIPWKIKGEQTRFRELTTGNVVVMGRRTFEEIGYPLPDRMNIVISKTQSFKADNCFTAASLKDALKMAEDNAKGKDIYICGGEQLYKEAIDIANVIFITVIDELFEGDTFFPEFDESKFELYVAEYCVGEIPYTYLTFKRK